MKCRHCGSPLQLTFLDLGSAPPSNAYLPEAALRAPETWFPLRLLVCETCWLVQTEDHAGREALFTDDYAYFSSFSSSWLAHAQAYVEAMRERLGLSAASRVVEVASNDGYLLQYVQAAGIPCYGVEPTASTAAAARAKGVTTMLGYNYISNPAFTHAQHLAQSGAIGRACGEDRLFERNRLVKRRCARDARDPGGGARPASGINLISCDRGIPQRTGDRDIGDAERAEQKTILGCLRLDPVEQRGDVRRDAGRSGKRRTIVGRQLVDDRQPRVDGRAVLGIDRAVHGRGEDDAATLLKPDEGRCPSRMVGAEVGAGDRHQPPAIGEPGQCRSDMAISGVGHAAGDVCHDGEWRVHKHDGGGGARREMIVDLGGVEARDGNGRKQRSEQIGAGFGQLVEEERSA